MDNRKWESGASANPPAAPAAPSSGYPTDGDPLASVPPTVPGAHWFYQLGEELRAILVAAGITPDHTNLTQLLTALRSAGVFLTAPQFDTSTKVATMEALQRALGNCRGTRLLSGAATLGVDDLGKKIICGGSGGYTVILPPVGSLPEGVTCPVWVNATNPVSFAAAGADVIYIGQGSSSVSPYSVAQGEQLEFTKYSGGWVISGSAQLKHSAGFGASLAGAGYQKLPGGLIFQWGLVSVNSGSFADVALPITFTNTILRHSVGRQGDSVLSSESSVAAQALSNAVLRFYYYSLAGGAATIEYIAIGY